MVTAERFSVTATAAVEVVTSEMDSLNVVVTNASDDPILLGGADVDDVNGYELPSGVSASLAVPSDDSLYALGTDGTTPQEVHTLRSSAV